MIVGGHQLGRISQLVNLDANPTEAFSPLALATRYGLVAAWNLDEASGARSDSFGANHLTDNNTVTSVTGKIDVAAVFTAANLEWLSVASNSALQTGNLDWWWSGWVYGTTLPSADIYSKYGASNNVSEFDIFHSTARFRAQVYDAAGVAKTAIANTFGAPSTATWYHLFVYNDSVNDTLNICVNGGAFDAVSTAAFVPQATAAPVNLGATNGAAGFWNGHQDAFAFGKSPPGGIAALAAEIRAYLFNGGAGRQYPLGWT